MLKPTKVKIVKKIYSFSPSREGCIGCILVLRVEDVGFWFFLFWLPTELRLELVIFMGLTCHFDGTLGLTWRSHFHGTLGQKKTCMTSLTRRSHFHGTNLSFRSSKKTCMTSLTWSLSFSWNYQINTLMLQTLTTIY